MTEIHGVGWCFEGAAMANIKYFETGIRVGERGGARDCECLYVSVSGWVGLGGSGVGWLVGWLVGGLGELVGVRCADRPHRRQQAM